MNSSTQTLIEALRILARDIESGDGVANACIAEAACKLQAAAELADIAHGILTYKNRGVLHDRLQKAWNKWMAPL